VIDREEEDFRVGTASEGFESGTEKGPGTTPFG